MGSGYTFGARASLGCELCKRERQQRQEAIDNIPAETVAYIQSAGCKLQKKSVIGAHNSCWKYLLGVIFKHGDAKRDVEFIGEDRQTTGVIVERNENQRRLTMGGCCG